MVFKDNPVVFLFKYMWRFAEGQKGWVLLYWTLAIIGNLIMLVEPLVIAWLLNTVQMQGVSTANLTYVLGIIAVLLAINVGSWATHSPSRTLERKVAFIVRANYRKYLVDGVLALPQKWHTDHHSGDTIDKIEKGVSTIFDFTSESFNIIRVVLSLVYSYIALIIFNWHSSYIVLILFIIVIQIIRVYDRRLSKQYKKLNRAENIVSERVFDIFSNVATVIILRLEKLVSKEIWKKIMSPYALYKNNAKLDEIKWFIVAIFVALMTVAILGSYIVITVFAGGIVLVGTLYALYGYTDRIGSVFFNFAWMYSSLVRKKTRIENAEELSKEFKKIPAVKETLPSNWKHIAIHNLTFSYHDQGHELHLKNVDFTFVRGERIALVGESGSGKTTFLKLIRALYNPKHAEVFVDGNLTNLKVISNDMTLIPQEPEIFATTIWENVTLGVSHRVPYVEKFAKMAQFLHIIKRLPKQWQSPVVEKGVNLSGGEKQRLALTRGLLASADRSIILMDEPTASVDTQNEILIYRNIFKNFKHKTIISTIHKLHLLSQFDRIYVFKKGKIVASGTLKEILKNSSDFRKSWTKYMTQKKRKIISSL
ncbi:MAG: ABC transporter ATP-binding protein [Nanoarchaeota archaeon]